MFVLSCASGDPAAPASSKPEAPRTNEPNEAATKPDACDKPEFNILIDNTFSKSEQETIYATAAEWSIKTDSTFVLQFAVVDKSKLFDDADHPSFISVFNRDPGIDSLGWASWDPGINAGKIYVLSQSLGEVFAPVMRHEFGHTFHLGHYGGQNQSVMADGNAPWSYVLTNQDIMDFCRIWKKCGKKCPSLIEDDVIATTQFLSPPTCKIKP